MLADKNQGQPLNKKQKRICFVSEWMWDTARGGAEYQMKLISEYLSRDYEIHLVGYTFNERYFICENSIHKHVLHRNKITSLTGLIFEYWSLVKILRDIKPDIIYQRVASSLTAFCAIYSRIYNCPFITQISSDIDLQPVSFQINKRLLFRFIDKIFSNYGISKSSKIIVQTKQQEIVLKNKYHRKAELILRNAHPHPKYNSKTKTDYLQKFKILWVGNYGPNKRPEIFVRIAEQFSTRTDVVFLMIGKKSVSKWQRNIDKKISKIKNLHYLGSMTIDEINDVLQETTVLVCTSEYEGFPNTFIQAWMRKVPVVSLNVDPDHVLEENAIGYHSKTFEQIVNDIRLLIDNSSLREKMGASAQKYAFENHTIEINFAPLRKLIMTMIT